MNTKMYLSHSQTCARPAFAAVLDARAQSAGEQQRTHLVQRHDVGVAGDLRRARLSDAGARSSCRARTHAHLAQRPDLVPHGLQAEACLALGQDLARVGCASAVL